MEEEPTFKPQISKKSKEMAKRSSLSQGFGAPYSVYNSADNGMTFGMNPQMQSQSKRLSFFERQ